MPNTLPVRYRGAIFGHALVDESDHARLSAFRWLWDGKYVIRNSKRNGRPCNVKLHHDVVGKRPPLVVDHINGNKLDNTRSNLRHCSKSLNTANYHARTRSASGLRGAFKERAKRKYSSHIIVNKKYVYLGTFSSALDAHAAYQTARHTYYGL